MADSTELGTARTIDLPTGRLAYRERGDGPPVVFVHGLLVNADLWRNVVPTVADAGFRCLAPDWPLGAHTIPMPPSADLSPPGVAGLIAEFLDALDLTDATIVANDTGGALTQLLMTEHPERIGKVVLTPCDAFDYFLPPGFKPLTTMAAVPGFVWLLSRMVRFGFVQRGPLAFGMVVKRMPPPEVVASYVRPTHDSAAVRRDTRRFLRGIDSRYTIAAAEKLPEFTRPVLLVGADDDKVFPPKLADRLAELLPDVRRASVADSYTFVPEDQPAELAKLVVDFLRS
ncbi:MAG TPA: alpha/beta hydrolase [Pseudonocardiaceae bacterium]|jgi:pimeloyl-ACP methyl ester carboxylesterase|nr:alpha/beta hydrolase [Pseudonocardiaceae bacterium]